VFYPRPLRWWGRIFAISILFAMLGLATILVVPRMQKDQIPQQQATAPAVPQQQATAPPGLYAYLLTHSLVVMSGNTEVYKYAGEFREATPLLWTNDGEYVVTLMEDDPADSLDRHSLVVINVSEKTVKTARCDRCIGLAITGSREVLAIASNAVWRFDISLDKPPAMFNIDLPVLPVGPEVVGGSPAGALVAASSREGGGNRGGPNELYVVKPNGDFALLGNKDDLTVIRGAASARSGKVAVIRYSSSSYCSSVSKVVVADPEAMREMTPDISAVTPYGYSSDAGPRIEAGLGVRSIWWEGDQLFATLSASTCHRGEYIPGQEMKDEIKTVTPSSVWKLSGERWERAEGVPGTVFRLSDSAVLLYDQNEQRSNEGRTLILGEQAQQTVVAKNVLKAVAPVR
jgi:hypothetical protein